MTGPEQHADTVRSLVRWLDTHEFVTNPDVDTARQAVEELVVLAERADTLERERGVAQEWGEFHQRRCGEALGERDSARAEADRLREAAQALVNAHARRHPNAAFWTLSERMALAEIRAALSAGEGTPA